MHHMRAVGIDNSGVHTRSDQMILIAMNGVVCMKQTPITQEVGWILWASDQGNTKIYKNIATVWQPRKKWYFKPRYNKYPHKTTIWKSLMKSTQWYLWRTMSANRKNCPNQSKLWKCLCIFSFGYVSVILEIYFTSLRSSWKCNFLDFRLNPYQLVGQSVCIKVRAKAKKVNIGNICCSVQENVWECVFIARIICCLRIEWSCRPASHDTDTPRSGGNDNAISPSCNSAIAAHFGKLMSGRLLALARAHNPGLFSSSYSSGAAPLCCSPQLNFFPPRPTFCLQKRGLFLFAKFLTYLVWNPCLCSCAPPRYNSVFTSFGDNPL